MKVEKKQTKRRIIYLVITVFVLAALIIGAVIWAKQRESLESEGVCSLGNGVVIRSVTKYSGTFVEDGTDRDVEDIIQLRVENTSEEDIQFLRIKAEQERTQHILILRPFRQEVQLTFRKARLWNIQIG